MCTSIALLQGGGYFGRNLDLEYSFGEQVVIMPRLFPPAFSQAAVSGQPFFHDRHGERGGRVSPLCRSGSMKRDSIWPD